MKRLKISNQYILVDLEEETYILPFVEEENYKSIVFCFSNEVSKFVLH